MDLIVHSDGRIVCVYGEELDLASLGSLIIRRASHVEPNAHGQWLADLAPVGGPKLGPFDQRSLALAAEQDWLAEHWLTRRA